MADNISALVDTTAQIDEGIWNALDQAGFVTDDDQDRVLDKAKLRLAIFDHVIKAKAHSKSERRQQALTKGALTKLVIPDADDEANDEVGRAVYDGLVRQVWNEVNPNQSGQVQKLVGEVTDSDGLGYVLVRTKVSVEGNPLDAVYVTTSYPLIADDFTSPLGQAVTRSAKRYAANATMLIQRGQNGKSIRKGLDTAMNNAQALAGSMVDLALPEGGEE